MRKREARKSVSFWASRESGEEWAARATCEERLSGTRGRASIAPLDQGFDAKHGGLRPHGAMGKRVRVLVEDREGPRRLVRPQRLVGLVEECELRGHRRDGARALFARHGA